MACEIGRSLAIKKNKSKEKEVFLLFTDGVDEAVPKLCLSFKGTSNQVACSD